MSISWEQKFPHVNPIKPDKGFSEVKQFFKNGTLQIS